MDVSQAPPKEWLPSNVTIRQWNVFDEVPEELIEQYDIVHLKLLVFVVKGDPVPILRNLLKMLKPGGWLQWAEPDVPSMRIRKTDASNTETALQRLFSLTAAQDPRLIPQWPSQLPGLMADQGLMQVEAHRVNANPHQEFAMHECNLLIYDMIAQRSAGNGSEMAKEITRLVPEAASESKGGAMFTFSRLTVIGRRSEEAGSKGAKF